MRLQAVKRYGCLEGLPKSRTFLPLPDPEKLAKKLTATKIICFKRRSDANTAVKSLRILVSLKAKAKHTQTSKKKKKADKAGLSLVANKDRRCTRRRAIERH